MFLYQNLNLPYSVLFFTEFVKKLLSPRICKRNIGWKLHKGELRDYDHIFKIIFTVILNIFQPSQPMCQLYKSDNLQYNMLVCWADVTNDSSTKRLMLQVLFSFHKIVQNSLPKPFQFINLFFL